MPCANLIAPLGPVLIAVRATSSRSLFNSFNLSVAKRTNKKKEKRNPEPEQIKQNPETFFQQKKNPNCKDFLWSQTARILLWSQTQTARISCDHRHECMSLEP
jgi:hypothetical protein